MSKFLIFLYQLTIQIYGLVIHIVAWFQPKARLWVNGRKGIFEKLDHTFQAKGDVLWMHCASLGEFEQGLPLLEQLKATYPTYKILLTFYSPSGYEIRKNHPLADYVCYLPLDTATNARRFISRVQPKLVFFVKYEFWYFYLKTLKEKQIPYYLIAGVFRPNQLFFKPYGKWYFEVIQGFNKIFLQDEGSLDIAKKYKLNQAMLIGDPRIDRVASIAKNAPEIKAIDLFKENKQLFILGSAHEKDWQCFVAFLKSVKNQPYFDDWRFIIAPHEIAPKQLAKIEQHAPFSTIRYTEWETLSQKYTPQLLILDTIGQLNAAYQYGDIAFIGGGFDKGIHNALEPAAFGLPILFGPNYQKFVEAKRLVKQNGAVVIKSTKDLITTFENLQNADERKRMGSISENYILNNRSRVEEIIGMTSF